MMCVCMFVCVSIMEYCSAVRKNEGLPFATVQMNLENALLSEMSKTILHNITYLWL